MATEMGLEEAVADQDRKIAAAKERQQQFPARHDDIQVNIDRLEQEKDVIQAMFAMEQQAEQAFGRAVDPDYRELAFYRYAVLMFQELIDEGGLDLETHNPKLHELHLAINAMVDKLDV